MRFQDLEVTCGSTPTELGAWIWDELWAALRRAGCQRYFARIQHPPRQEVSHLAREMILQEKLKWRPGPRTGAEQ